MEDYTNMRDEFKIPSSIKIKDNETDIINNDLNEWWRNVLIGFKDWTRSVQSETQQLKLRINNLEDELAENKAALESQKNNTQ